MQTSGNKDYASSPLQAWAGDVRGDISVNFMCDPKISWKLVDIVLDEISRLQEEGPSEQDVLTVLEIEQRAHENGLQDGSSWVFLIAPFILLHRLVWGLPASAAEDSSLILAQRSSRAVFSSTVPDNSDPSTPQGEKMCLPLESPPSMLVGDFMA